MQAEEPARDGKTSDAKARPSTASERKRDICEDMQRIYDERGRALRGGANTDAQRERLAKDHKKNRDELGCQ
ncbi:hypothetical protein [Niveibacterium sp. 24ML]|uniref:hypothetical protein n=1 Tax=Niveibacterium sp. 24ML TaxID=2985512 RepID=UPI00226D87D5|nr:hypothetical protein [Niveibacterium sp. 24ML]